jgi:CheY-like chemotaxis protein
VPPANILCLDDDRVLLHLVKSVLRKNGYSVFGATNGHQALQLQTEHRLDVAVIDQGLPDMHGGEVARQIKARCQDVAVIMYTGAEDLPAGTSGCIDALVRKGEGANELLSALRLVLDRAGRRKKDLRKFGRTAVQFPFSVTVERCGKIVVLAGSATDIGEGGLGGTVEGRLTPGEQVLLSIPQRPGHGAETKPAQVRYQNQSECGFAFLKPESARMAAAS